MSGRACIAGGPGSRSHAEAVRGCSTHYCTRLEGGEMTPSGKVRSRLPRSIAKLVLPLVVEVLAQSLVQLWRGESDSASCISGMLALRPVP